MTTPLTFLRKVIPHNSPLRLYYTRGKNALAPYLVPVDTKGMQIIGVTGTDGKTTTVEMMAHILQELNIPAITASSYAIKHNGEILSMSKRTTSSAAAVHKLLKKAIAEKAEVVVLEASSHSFVQWRLQGVLFDIAVLTNITHEHLNFHKTIENYAAAKKLLFTKHLQKGGTAILPTNDAFGKKWLKELPNTPPLYSNQLPYSPEKSNAITDKYGTAWVYEGKHYQMPMLGAYNAGNAVAAALAISALKDPQDPQKTRCTTERALDAMRTFEGLPGRMQLVSLPESASKNITVLVDFALTEKALSSALTTCRDIIGGETSPNKVISVFGGSGGQHDASVHPGLAKAAAQGADIVIITDDEPYDGDPKEIRANLIHHIKETSKTKKLGSSTSKFEYYDIADRRAALAKAVALAHDGDVIIATGMGHYTSRTVNGKEVPWNDADVLREIISKSL